MPDITMCKGTRSPICTRCYRLRAVSSARQSWFVTPPIVDGVCEQHIAIEKTNYLTMPFDSEEKPATTEDV